MASSRRSGPVFEATSGSSSRKFGFYHDGAGKRYQIAPHMLLGDNDGALAFLAFRYFGASRLRDTSGARDHDLLVLDPPGLGPAEILE